MRSANPDKKAADLISFDAFADEEQGMSGHGGLALPTSGPSGSNSTSPMQDNNLSPGGLPLDLFSTPSSAPAPNAMSSLFATSSASAAPKQDPMAFFRNTPPIQAQAQQPPPGYPQAQYGYATNGSVGGGWANSNGNGNGTPRSATPSSFAPMQAQPQQSRQGLAANSSGTGQLSRQQQQPPQQQTAQKKDAFADLVNLMD